MTKVKAGYSLTTLLIREWVQASIQIFTNKLKIFDQIDLYSELLPELSKIISIYTET